jgi:D-alanine transaminase
MARTLPIVFLDGAFVPVESARVSPLDRGFLFADAVYEVIAVYGGRALLLDAHLRRLARSLAELDIAAPHTDAGWRSIVGQLIARNGSGDMGVYLQVTRGADSGRDHAFPAGIRPTVFAMASPLAPTNLATAGVRAITGPDTRWARCDIKTTALLANVLLRQAAAEAGAGEFIMLRNGFVTEGSGSSVLIVEAGVLFTRPDGHEILPGTTIRLVREVAEQAGIGYREEPISESRLRSADEVLLTAALRGVAPVTHVDGRAVGGGAPGPVWRTVAEAYELRKKTG